MQIKKVKRFYEGGLGDSNEGMAEAYDKRKASELTSTETEDRDAAKEAQVADRIRVSDATEPEREASSSSTSKAEPAKAKPKMITMTQVKAAGFDNLRDYLNKQQGLTRKGGAAPSKPATSVTASKGTISSTDVDTVDRIPKDSSKDSAVDRIPRDTSTVPEGESASGSELGRNVKNTMNAMVGTALPRAAMGMASEFMAAKKASNIASKAAAERAARVAARRETSAAQRESLREVSPVGRESVTNPLSWLSGPKNARDNFKKGGMAKTFAQGGSVSASRRGDGIASKGKTRGRMC